MALSWGVRGRRFKSSHTDQLLSFKVTPNALYGEAYSKPLSQTSRQYTEFTSIPILAKFVNVHNLVHTM